MKKLLQLRTPRNPGGLACLLLLLAGLLAPVSAGAQTVTVRENGKTVRELLSVIEARVGVYFFYSDADVDLDRTASIDADGQPLASVLDNLFRNSTTTYTIS
ncbi:MAG: STN domain-containing protein, partial [Alistipes sp.]|nr:STN domain-containing protein [Alistipes sp.]